MANVNLGIIINATNKAAPILATVTKQVDAAKKKAEEGGYGGAGLSTMVRGVAGLGSGALKIATASLQVFTTLLQGLGSIFGIVGRIGTAAFNAVKGALSGVAAAATGVIRHLGNIVKWLLLIGAVAVASLARDSINAASEMEGYLAKLTTALKDVKKAQDMLDWAKAFAAKTPFETGQVVDAAVRLEMYGLSAKKWLPLIGDLAGAMGKDVTDGVEAVADAVSGGGLERLKEFAITSQKLKAAGWTGSYQDAEGIRTLKAALESIIKGNYGGGMDKLSKTGIGALSNFKDAISALKVEIGQALMPAFRRMLQYGMQVLDWFKQMGVGRRVGEWLGSLADRVLGLAQRALPVLVRWLSNAYQGVQNLVAGIRESANFERLTTAIGKVWAVLQSFVSGLADSANVGGFVDGVIGRLAGALEWLLANVLTPGSLQAAVNWAYGLFAGVSGFLSNLASFVSSNFQAIGAWLKYFVDMGKFVVAWAYKHLPDMLSMFVSTFSGIADAIMILQTAWNGLATGVKVVADIIAAAMLGVVAAVMEGVALMAQGLRGVLYWLNKIPGVNLDKFEKAAKYADETARKYRDAAWGGMLSGAGAGEDLRKGVERDAQLDAQRARVQAMQDRSQAWADNTRQKFAGVPEPVMPTAPKVQFQPLPPMRPAASAPTINFNNHVQVDARGANDPAAVRQAAQQGAFGGGQEALRAFRRNANSWGLQPQGVG